MQKISLLLIINFMKKILIILLSVFLASCGTNIDSWKNTKKIEENKSFENNNLRKENKKITFDEVINNLEKLKDLDSDWLEKLNSFILDLEKNKLITKIKKSWDIEKCNLLDKKFQDNCKREIIFSKKDIKLCEKLSNTWAVISCKNDININIAFEKFNIEYCDKLIDNSKNKELINACKWEISYEIKERKKDTK